MKSWLLTSLAHPFVARLAIAKSLGFIVGLLAFITLPIVWSETPVLFQWGMLLWYMTLGGVIGIMGVMTQHPAVPWFPFSSCFRGAFMGAWFHILLVFFAYDTLSAMMVSIDIFGLTSPWWIVIDGTILGILIDFIATKYAGEGKTVTKDLK